MRNVLAILSLLLALALCACAAGTGKTGSNPDRSAQLAAGSAYLDATAQALSGALDRAVALNPDNAAAINAQVRPVLEQVQAATGAFNRTIQEDQANADPAWRFARGLVTTAVEVLAPVAINALVHR